MLEHATTLPRAPHRTVLLLVGEPSVRELIAANLRYAGYYPVGAGTASAARQLIGEILPDAILIDMDTEPSEASAFASGLGASAAGRKVAVLMLATRAGDAAAPCCPGAARADCMSKPFHPQELVQRVTRLLGEPLGRAPRVLRVGALELDPAAHTVTVTGLAPAGQLHLPAGEFRLLRYMMTHPDRVLRREQLMAGIWGARSSVGLRTVDQMVKRLRAVLQTAGLEGMVCTVRGLGYRLSATRE